jgi:hypothetical protein
MTAARASTVFISDDNTTNGERIRWISSDSKPDSFHGTGNDFQETSGVPVKRFRPGERIDEELFCEHKVHSFCGGR